MEKSQERKTRAFIALDLPDEIREKLAKLKGELQISGSRFVSKENLHLTMFFLGDLDNAKLKEVESALEDLEFPAFEMTIEKIRVLGLRNRMYFFADIGRGNSEIKEIHSRLYPKLESIGIKMEKREYLPHITIARILNRKAGEHISAYVDENQSIVFGNFECDSIKLKSSTFTRTGPVYSDLYVKELR